MFGKEEDTLIQKAEDLEVLTRNLKIIPRQRLSELHELTRISKSLFNYVPSTIAEPLGLVFGRINQKKRQNILIALFITVIFPVSLGFLLLQVLISNPTLLTFSPPLEAQILSVVLLTIVVFCFTGSMHSIGHLLVSGVTRISMLGAYPKFFGLLWVWETNYEEFLEAGGMKRTLLYMGGPFGTLTTPLLFWFPFGLDMILLVFAFLVILEIVGSMVGFFTDVKKGLREFRIYRIFKQKEG
ncbi:MAG: hypothetical protein ACXACA_03990 [Candidatus Ranarchaeia archaeon]